MKKKHGYWVLIGGLVLVLIVLSILTSTQNPSILKADNGIKLLNGGKVVDGKISIRDPYDGDMEIPKYEIPRNEFDREQFIDETGNGVIKYGTESAFGINVSSKKSDINWEKVKASGIEFVMIRVGYRGVPEGKIQPDTKFDDFIKGATDVGLDVGVYFYSLAKTEDEAEQEATFVLEKIKNHKITYPVSFNWEFVGSDGKAISRTKDCTPEEVTRVAKAFCTKIEKEGYQAAFYTDKNMGYTYFDLEDLSKFDVWYSDYNKIPSFYYDFQIWQYAEEGEVSGINGFVHFNIALKNYKSSE